MVEFVSVVPRQEQPSVGERERERREMQIFIAYGWAINLWPALSFSPNDNPPMLDVELKDAM